MKNLFILLLSLIAAISLILNFSLYRELSGSSYKTLKNQIISEVTNVVDGDTFDLKTKDRVRLALIDAPEFPKDCYSLQAKERLSQMILNRNVEIDSLKKDNFGRILGITFVDDLFVNKSLVSEGYAKFSPQSSQTVYDVELIQAETEAKSAKRGLWSNLCLQKNENCLIKGNVRKDNDTKIYHLPNCFNYPKIVIDEKLGDRWFCSEVEAQKAGFTKSRDCP